MVAHLEATGEHTEPPCHTITLRLPIGVECGMGDPKNGAHEGVEGTERCNESKLLSGGTATSHPAHRDQWGL